MRRCWRYPVLLLCAAAACQGDPEPETQFASVPLWSESDRWVVGATLLRLGHLDDDRAVFDGIRAVRWIGSDRIAVADGSRTVRVFDLQGFLTSQFGGSGGGPTEFERIDAIHKGRGDTLWVADGLRRRVVGFTQEGTFLAAYPIEDIPPFINTWVLGFWANDDPVMQGLRLVRPAAPAVEGPLSPNFLEWHRFERSSEVGERLSRAAWREEWGHRWMDGYAEGEVIFGGRGTAAVTKDGLLVARGGTAFEVEAVDSVGRRMRRFGREWAPRVPTGEDHRAYVDWRLENAPSNADLKAWRRVLEELPVREYFPAIASIRVDALDHIWIRHAAPPQDEAATWSVFDPTYRWLGEVDLPGEFKPGDIGDDYLLGTSRDELGVEEVVMLQLLKPGGH